MLTTRRLLAKQLIQRPKFNAHTSCGIVGYPNIGKSTLFNSMAQRQLAQAKNYPFCTIDPNVAKVAVTDRNIRALTKAA